MHIFLFYILLIFDMAFLEVTYFTIFRTVHYNISKIVQLVENLLTYFRKLIKFGIKRSSANFILLFLAEQK